MSSEAEVGLLDRLFVNPASLPGGFGGFVQLLFLLAVYGFILFNASNLISDGSELLLLIPALAGIVGSVVLPILGAVPDGAIVLFSGLGTNAQAQLGVGVGALAGSTIMLLTIPWVLTVISGRVNLDENGKGSYHKKPKLDSPWNFSLMRTGVNARPYIRINAVIMILSAVSYCIIQGPAFFFHCAVNHNSSDSTECDTHGEKWWAFAGFIMATLCFIGYLVFQFATKDKEENKDRIDEVKKKAVNKHLISLSAVFVEDLFGGVEATSDTHLLEELSHSKRFTDTVKGFFNKHDRDHSGTLDREEMVLLLKDMNENPTKDELQQLIDDMDTDKNGVIDFDEFKNAMVKYIRHQHEMDNAAPAVHVQAFPSDAGVITDDPGKVEDDLVDEEENVEEEEEIPEDLQHLTPKQQKLRIRLRALWMLGLGTLLVVVFSDPMVGVLNEFGERTPIPPFYFSFVLAPLASNASELIATLNYAKKKTQKTTTISFATVIGAAIMNNTFCLAIFLILVFARNLAWEFSAETISILFVEIVMLFFGLLRVHRTWEIIPIILLYPLSLGLVILLEGTHLMN